MDPGTVRAGFERLARLAGEAAGRADRLVAIAGRYRATLERGGTLLFAGNGGSAAQAQHIAAEYVVGMSRSRPGGALAALALPADPAVLTAAGNDLGFDQVFARQVTALGRPGDLLVLLSTSGESPNLLAAARAAATRGIATVGFLGGTAGGGPLAPLVDEAFLVPSDDPARTQEIHLAAQHLIRRLLEEDRS